MAAVVAQVPERIRWAVDLLDVHPHDRVLELGCGSGVAVALVCDRLDEGGRLTAIDRSATAVERTRARNAEHVDRGLLRLEQVDLAHFRVEPGEFTKAFAVNVNVFWTQDAARECEILAEALAPGGVVRLVYGGPGPGRARSVGPGVAAKLEAHGFDTEVMDSPSAAMVCVTGHRRG